MTDTNNHQNSESDVLKVYEIVKKYRDGERDFEDINLNEINLSRINLVGANLSGASLSVANLSASDLREVNLSRANLNVARLSNANLTKAILNQATINVANLARVDLTEAQLINSLLIRAELIRAKLTKANFTQANLNGADLRETKLQQTNFNGANLSGANLRGASGALTKFTKTDLRGADLVKVNLPKADFSNAELRQANLTYANLSNADFSGANMRWIDLQGADLSGANLTEANLSGANLSGANLSSAVLVKASLVHADLSQANLIRANWSGADLSGATLTGAKLYQVSRFNLKADEITCEWVDLSANGDHSQVYHFDRESLRKFFNQTRPIVEILVNSSLDQDANMALANIYHKIAQEFPVMERPPSLEVGDRTTKITFIANQEQELFAIGCLAILPFDDAPQTQKNIVNLLRQIQDSGLTKERRSQLLSAMSKVIAKVNEMKKIARTIRSEFNPPFFSKPTRTQLTNGDQKMIMVHENSQISKLNPSPNSGSDANSTPNFDQVMAFINSFNDMP
ncbi:pentapeptide repeat-containing protein [Arthrospira platensis BEA 1257B]